MEIDWNHLLLSVVRAEMVAILVLWSKVLFHYGRAARAEWLQQGGKLRGLFWEIVHPFTWAWHQQLARWGIGKPFPKSAYETYTPYTPGVILRFAIWAAALAPAMAFLRFFTEPYNNHVTMSTLVLSVVLFFFSIMGALAHLYVAHRQRPMRWMYIGVWSTVWAVAGPIIFYVASPPPILL